MDYEQSDECSIVSISVDTYDIRRKRGAACPSRGANWTATYRLDFYYANKVLDHIQSRFVAGK